MKDALGAVQSVLVLGGGSEIGLATYEDDKSAIERLNSFRMVHRG